MPIYIYKNNQQAGPFDENVVLEMLRNGQLLLDDLAVRHGQSQWQPLRDLYSNDAVSSGSQSTRVNNQIQSSPQKNRHSKGLPFFLLGLFVVMAILGLVALITLLNHKARSSRRSVNIQPVNTKSNGISSNSTLTSGGVNSVINANNNLNNSNNGSAPFKDFVSKADEIARTPLAEGLTPKATIKGKTAIVIKPYAISEKFEVIGFYYDGTAANNDYELKQYGLSRERLATSQDEIDSLVKITCNKGKIIGVYKLTTGETIPAYSIMCSVEIVDYQERTILAKKIFENRKLEKNIEVIESDTENINLPPYEEIRKYVKSFSKSSPEVTNASQLPNIEDSKTFASEPDKFGKLNFPLKLDSNAKIKGKITTVQVKDDAVYDYIDAGSMIGINSSNGTLNPPLPNAIILTKESLGFTDEQIAMKSSEIDTLIQVRCKRGSLITKVKGISVFSNVCAVNIIDYKGLTVVARKTFEGKKVNNDRYIYPSGYEDKKDTVDFPRAEIEEYIKSFPKG